MANENPVKIGTTPLVFKRVGLGSLAPGEFGREVLESETSDEVNEKLGRFWSRLELRSTHVADYVTKVRVLGYYNAGDCHPMDFIRVETQSPHGGWEQSGDGTYWELVSKSSLQVTQFGAKGDNVTDDTSAFTDALSYCEHLALLFGGAASLHVPQGQYRTTGVFFNPTAYTPIKIYGDGPDSTMICGVVGSTSPILKINATAPTFFHGHIEIADLTLDGDGHGASSGLEMNEVWYSVIRNVRTINCIRGYNLLTCIYVDIYSPDIHWNTVGINIDKLPSPSFPDALPAIINIFGGLIRINSRIGLYADYFNTLNLWGTGIEYNGTIVGDTGHGGVIIGANVDRSGKASGLNWDGGWLEGNKGDAGVSLYSGVNAIRNVRGWEPADDTNYSIRIYAGQYTFDNLTTTGGSIKEESGVSTGNRIACCYNFTRSINSAKTGVDEGASIKKAFVTVGGSDVAVPSLVVQNATSFYDIRMVTSQLAFLRGSEWVLYLDANKHVLPGTDGQQNLGQAVSRFNTVYATTGTINTSDERDKQDILSLSDVEKRVAARLRALLKKYKFKESVEKKGEKARFHVGIVAQDVISAFEEEGLDAHQYAMLCYDEWVDLPEIVDEETGKIAQKAQKAGNRYGVRYDNLFAFILSAM
ncbi:tail fiber domain-containing protein [Brucella inopinata]|uniref:tail fiber domain-containing protein n=1 Tax=Brucella inopinata TaxID=1218315 RepID=UPI000870E796|nr:tail fiber domain-containing protein [Brucella inopinata]SCD22800.1 hypothetical protein BR141012304_10358 [Brucella inopinata]